MQHQHDGLDGPVRGSRAWWRGLGNPENTDHTDDPQERTSMKDDPSIRWSLVNRVRREIAQGTYDTPEKWNAALDRLLDQMEG